MKNYSRKRDDVIFDIIKDDNHILANFQSIMQQIYE